jgi:hypothetical protein
MFYQLLIWFWPVNEMIELVCGMPAPQFGDESFVRSKIRAGSSFKQFLCFVLLFLFYYCLIELQIGFYS